MISTKNFNKIYGDIKKSRMNKRFNKAHPAATISGPSIIIEMVVKKASLDSKIPMDWYYVGGRGIVYTLGDVKESRKHLFLNIPQSNLNMLDL